MRGHLLNERGFLGLAAVGDKAREEMCQEVERTAMAGMLNLTDVFELIVDALDDRPFAQEELVREGHHDVAHVFAQFGDELGTLSEQELLGEGVGDIAFVTKELAEKTPCEASNGLSVVDGAGGQTIREQLAPVVDH